jgi:hypothetical protein
MEPRQTLPALFMPVQKEISKKKRTSAKENFATGKYSIPSGGGRYV